MNAIEIKNLTKVYGKNRGIQDINISVKEGNEVTLMMTQTLLLLGTLGNKIKLIIQ